MEHVATDPVSTDTTGLAQDILADDRASSPEDKAEVKKVDAPTENEPAPPGDKPEDNATPASSDPATTEPGTPPEPKDGDEPQDSIKIGNQVFATYEDAFNEANRVIGHNANLAGSVKRAEAEKAALQAQLDEAIQANQEWAEWAKNAGDGKIDPTVIAKHAVAEYINSTKEADVSKNVAEQVKQIQAADNFHVVESTIMAIAQKINPLTDKYYTPIEAYDFACKQHGVENAFNRKPAAPKPPGNAPRNAAARPTGQGSAPAPKDKAPDAPDEADRLLSATLSQY